MTVELSHNSDTNYYTPLNQNPLSDYKSEIDLVIKQSLTRGWITEKESEFLSVKHPICPVFYGLPKIHKSLQNPPLRPIVSLPRGHYRCSEHLR